MEKTTKSDPFRDVTKPLPRGHAYMRFRNKGYSIHVDFPEKHVEWLEGVIKHAMAKLNEDERRFAEAKAKK